MLGSPLNKLVVNVNSVPNSNLPTGCLSTILGHNHSPGTVPHPSALPTSQTRATKIKDRSAERYLADVALTEQLIKVNEVLALEAVISLWSDLRLYAVGLALPDNWKVVEKHFSSRHSSLRP
ncbi:hypothetical protein FB451DRAFT_1367277 [Mycena latifolia]|nr:hypothetical protein FB451DRAFT_1367277 [Mycena latifolia]